MKKGVMVFLGTVMFMSFLLVLFSVSFVWAESVNGKEWWILNITNETIDENGVMWGNVSNYTTNPKINNTPQFEVLATMESTLWWAEVNLSTDEVNFGKVEKGNYTTKSYNIWARGTVDVNVIPTLKNESEKIFSDYLFFSRTPSSGFEDEQESKIGSYVMRFNLTFSPKEWLAIGASKMENRTSSNGKQYIRLDLTDFNKIIPFDVQIQNTVVFQVVPIWSSVEPISEEGVYKEYIEGE